MEDEKFKTLSEQLNIIANGIKIINKRIDKIEDEQEELKDGQEVLKIVTIELFKTDNRIKQRLEEEMKENERKHLQLEKDIEERFDELKKNP